jgi:lysophospholipase L1-like esterase
VSVEHLDGVGYTITTDSPRPGTVVTVAQPVVPDVPPRRLAVLGDSFSDEGFTGPNGWPRLVAQRIGADLTNLAAAGSGYVQATAHTFTYAAAALLPTDATLVVVFGGLNDDKFPLLEVRWAAAATYAAIRLRAPAARLLVIGPQWPATPPTDSIRRHRDNIAHVAADAGAAFLDPIDWFQHRPDLIGSDGWHPNDNGQRLLADRITPVAAAALTN